MWALNQRQKEALWEEECLHFDRKTYSHFLLIFNIYPLSAKINYKSTSLLKYYFLLVFINFQGRLPLFILVTEPEMFPYHRLKDENL